MISRRDYGYALLVLPLAYAALGCESPSAEEPAGIVRAHIDVDAPVVISQVYGGGGNSLATYRNDFVELFNRSSSVQSLTDWSVQYASATGTGNFASNSPVALAGSLLPGQHLLVQLASGGAVGSPLPTPDVIGTINMSATAGKVVLARSATGLACNGGSVACTGANLTNIVDLVGFGNANYFEGSAAAPTLSSALAAMRAVNGCTDTNQNGSDFSAGAVAPRNTASPATPCSTGNVPPQVSSTNPSSGAGNVAVDTNIGVTFSEAVVASGSWFAISCSASGSVSATVSGGPQAYSLDPSITLQPVESCTVTITATNIVDGEGTPMAESHVFTFSTAAPVGVIPIRTIQGASHVSPLENALVTTRGIVTAKASNGYYLQDPAPDADDATSEAVFVFTSSAPAVSVGDDVQVSATVSEFRPGCNGCAPSSSAYSNLTTTELTTVTAQSTISSGNALPAAVVLGSGGRTPPSSVIEDDATGDVEVVANSFDPSSDGLDFYESLEAMRVQINNAVAVGPTAAFSGGSLELPVLVDNGGAAGLRTARGGIVVSVSDFNPERIALANELVSALPEADVGDTLPGAIRGVIGYTFANYKLFYTEALPALVDSGVTPEVTSLGTRRAVDLDIAAFNVENLDPLDPASKFAQLASILVTNLKSPDIVALEEIQDNNGATNDAVVDASATLNQLVAAISSAGGPTYQHRSINPVSSQDGGEPGGNIRVAFLYRTDRGLSFVDRPGAGSSTPNSVVSGPSGPELQYSPGRIDPTNSAFNNSRKPLAGQFSFLGRTFFVIANHFNSKGGDEPLFGRFQPPTLSSEAQRVSQANVVKGFVSQILSIAPTAQVVVLGDLNDFEFSAPLAALKSVGLSALIEGLPANERYTYVYQGNSQALDHILVTSATTSHVLAYDVVHVNAEFATQASDHDPGVARLSFDYTAPVVSGPSVNPVVTATGPNGAIVTYSVTALDDQDGALAVTCSPASGSQFAIGTTPVSCTATDISGNASHFDFAVTVNPMAAAAAPALPVALSAGLGTLLAALGLRRTRRMKSTATGG